MTDFRSMYDVCGDLQAFYDKHVRLGTERRNDLAGKRDLNIQRVKNGLDKMAAETGRARPHPYGWLNQGGYAMHTLNQDPQDASDYDIDVALFFRKDALPTGALDARKRICEALSKSGANFSKDPEARTNAVTVYYGEGYHLDFAVFRTFEENGITRYEHASTDWTARDPAAVTAWFQKQVDERSPKEIPGLYKPTVAPGQLRRIVRFAKWFCRSRSSWCLPGGMVVTSLVSEVGVYQASSSRDDRALYDTLVALRDRLKRQLAVFNPVDGMEITARSGVLKEVERLRDRLDENIPKLDVLFRSDCTRAQARSAWDWIFSHDYWASKEIARKSLVEASDALASWFVEISCGVADSEGGRLRSYYRSGNGVLPKGLALHFTVARTNAPSDAEFTWICRNEGDEASDDGQLSWQKPGRELWTTTQYKGTQRMTCRVSRNGVTLTEKAHVVRIARGPVQGLFARRSYPR